MANVLTYGLLIIAIIGVAVFIYLMYPPAIRVLNIEKRNGPSQAVIKRDWLPTGRIDFATQLTATASEANDQPNEFRLLVEERRIVESIAGNENLEIQWRLATLKEAKAVVTQYHNYLSENSLIKSVIDDTASSPPPMTARDGPSPASGPSDSLVADKPQLSHEPERQIQTDRPSAH